MFRDVLFARHFPIQNTFNRRIDLYKRSSGLNIPDPISLDTGFDLQNTVTVPIKSLLFASSIFVNNCHVMSDQTFYSYFKDTVTSDYVCSLFQQVKIEILSWLKIDVGDVQSTILLFLLAWLLVNIILIKIAWSLYGQHICEKFLRQG